MTERKNILRLTFLYEIQMKMTNMNCHNNEFIGKVINTLATNELSKKRKKEKFQIRNAKNSGLKKKSPMKS